MALVEGATESAGDEGAESRKRPRPESSEAAESPAEALAAAKRRALEAAKRAALARILGGDDAESDSAAAAPEASGAAVGASDADAPAEAAGLTAPAASAEAGDGAAAAAAASSDDGKAEEDADEAGGMNIMEFLRKQSEEARGKVLVYDGGEVPGVLTAKPVYEKREPKAAKRTTALALMASSSDEAGGTLALAGSLAGAVVSDDGRVVGRAAPKAVGSWAWGDRDGGGGVYFRKPPPKAQSAQPTPAQSSAPAALQPAAAGSGLVPPTSLLPLAGASLHEQPVRAKPKGATLFQPAPKKAGFAGATPQVVSPAMLAAKMQAAGAAAAPQNPWEKLRQQAMQPASQGAPISLAAPAPAAPAINLGAGLSLPSAPAAFGTTYQRRPGLGFVGGNGAPAANFTPTPGTW